MEKFGQFMTSPLVQQGGLFSSPVGLLLIVYAGGIAYEMFVSDKKYSFAEAAKWPLRRIEDIKDHFAKDKTK